MELAPNCVRPRQDKHLLLLSFRAQRLVTERLMPRTDGDRPPPASAWDRLMVQPCRRPLRQAHPRRGHLDPTAVSQGCEHIRHALRAPAHALWKFLQQHTRHRLPEQREQQRSLAIAQPNPHRATPFSQQVPRFPLLNLGILFSIVPVCSESCEISARKVAWALARGARTAFGTDGVAPPRGGAAIHPCLWLAPGGVVTRARICRLCRGGGAPRLPGAGCRR